MEASTLLAFKYQTKKNPYYTEARSSWLIAVERLQRSHPFFMVIAYWVK